MQPLCTALLVCTVLAFSQAHDGYYIASVVEFTPATPPDGLASRDQALALMYSNLDRYSGYMAAAKANGTQIIVFPEYGITGMRGPKDNWQRDLLLPFLEPIPDPDNASIPLPRPLNPCLQSAYFFPTVPITVRVSCLARQHALYLVVDYGDVVSCQPGVDNPCRGDRRAQFNTAVVFAPDGTLLTKYRKRRLMDEQGWYDVETPGQNKSFTTNFGVTFGVFICFDVFFEQDYYYRNIAYPTEWDNGAFPGFNATEQQQRYSYNHAVNFLAANYGLPWNTGSGIWSQGQPLAMWINPTDQGMDKLLTAAVPILLP